jgi:hypothetical protein
MVNNSWNLNLLIQPRKVYPTFLKHYLSTSFNCFDIKAYIINSLNKKNGKKVTDFSAI